MKISVYKSELTGHWIVDKYGTKERPGTWMERLGFKHFTDALGFAIECADAKRAGKYNHEIMTLRG